LDVWPEGVESGVGSDDGVEGEEPESGGLDVLSETGAVIVASSPAIKVSSS
jgi:hypothetical protein